MSDHECRDCGQSACECDLAGNSKRSLADAECLGCKILSQLEEERNGRIYAETLAMQDPCLVPEHTDLQLKLDDQEDRLRRIAGSLKDESEGPYSIGWNNAIEYCAAIASGPLGADFRLLCNEAEEIMHRDPVRFTTPENWDDLRKAWLAKFRKAMNGQA